MSNLTELKTQFLDARAQAASLADELETRTMPLRAAIEALQNEWNNANAELVQEHADAVTSASTAETALRQGIVEAFRETGSKQLGGGLSVRVNKRLVYDDKRALAWAKEHGLCLALDKKAFEKIAAVDQPDFVAVEESPVAVIAS